MKSAVILLLCVVGVALAYQYQYEEVRGNCNGMYENFRDRCPYEPCSRSECSMEGAFCRNNFCGGCHAFWYQNNGDYCHECSNYFMNWEPHWWYNYYRNYNMYK